MDLLIPYVKFCFSLMAKAEGSEVINRAEDILLRAFWPMQEHVESEACHWSVERLF